MSVLTEPCLWKLIEVAGRLRPHRPPDYVQASDTVARLPSEPAIVSATTAVMPANVTDLMTRASPSVEPGQP